MEVGLGSTLLARLVSINIGATSASTRQNRYGCAAFRRCLHVHPLLRNITDTDDDSPPQPYPQFIGTGIGGGIAGARLVRSAVIGIKSNMYVSASEAVGSSPLRTLLVHISRTSCRR